MNLVKLRYVHSEFGKVVVWFPSTNKMITYYREQKAKALEKGFSIDVKNAKAEEIHVPDTVKGMVAFLNGYVDVEDS